MNALQRAYYILRYMGPGVVKLRARIYLDRYLGRTRRRFAARPWSTIRLADIVKPGTPTGEDEYGVYKREQGVPFLFPLAEPPSLPGSITHAQASRTPDLRARLALLAEDRCVYFFRTPSPEAIDWHRNALEQTQGPVDRVWCDIADFLPDQGDARTMWEPSRAAWAIDLARAGAHGVGDVDAPLLMWRWVDSWMDANSPFDGFNWKCGQESSVRLIAVAMGIWSLASTESMVDRRWLQFARLAWATGYRVAHHINYAISQRNNHAISEACGLILVSHLFPEFREAATWSRLGRRVLAAQLRRQIYADGSYIQHSMNYHRVMLDMATLGLRLGELANRPFDRDLYALLGRSGEFLFQMMEPSSGRLPQYGHNDGAHVLPLTECDFNDYRPVIQATHYLACGKRLLPEGPWDEQLVWLFGSEALQADRVACDAWDDDPEDHAPVQACYASEPVSSSFDVGGYYTIRRPGSWAMVRCHTYRDRPGQCDPLHVDLWWRGLNILQDCGTYRYYVPGRLDVERYFKSIAGHNTIEVDGLPPCTFLSRFLWFPWSRCKAAGLTLDEDGTFRFSGTCHDYARRPWQVVHQREVVSFDSDWWRISDVITGSGTHTITLRWHMIDVPYDLDETNQTVTLRTPAGVMRVGVECPSTDALRFVVRRGDEEPDNVQGFASPYYAHLDPIPTLEAEFRALCPIRIVTTVAVPDAEGMG